MKNNEQIKTILEEQNDIFNSIEKNLDSLIKKNKELAIKFKINLGEKTDDNPA